MKRTRKALLTLVALGAASLNVPPMAVAEENSPTLKDVLQAIESLRDQVERLESRLDRLEEQQHNEGPDDVADRPSRSPSDGTPSSRERLLLPRRGAPSYRERLQHEMPWLHLPPQGDRGLYVFPTWQIPNGGN